MIVVQKSRDISEEVSSRTGVRHESPQVILVRNGATLWTASHWKITAEAVRTAVSDFSKSDLALENRGVSE